MKVKDLMTEKVYTVGPDDPVDKVFVLFHYEGIRHVPVVEKKKVVGIVSDRDMKKILGPKTQTTLKSGNDKQFNISPRKVRTIMRRNVLTVGPEELSSDAAAIMAKRKIGCLPVAKNGRLVGILSATDILKAYVKLSQTFQKLKKELGITI